MLEQQSEKPVLIYFKIRGHAQIIRSVLLEIGVEFQEIFVTNNGYLDLTIIQKYRIQIQNLPYLIHKGNAIHEIFPIMKYLCAYFNRGDLLGKTIQDSIKISQILVKYMKEKNTILSILLQGLKEIQEKKLGEQALEKLAEIMAATADRNKYCQATEKMFIKTGQYLFGYLTILDFIFYENCFYYVNMLTVNNKSKGQLTKRYIFFFQHTDFYLKNKQFLEQYKIFVQQLDPQTSELLQKMWVGDKKYIQPSQI